MANQVTRKRLSEFNDIVDSARLWAQASPDIRAIGLAGSWAADRARMDSDVDLVVLTHDKEAYVADAAWVSLATGIQTRIVNSKAWGPLTERRVRLPSGFEIEYGFAPTSWAEVAPIDQGSASVIKDGFRILYDPDNLLSRLVTIVIGQ